MLRRGAHGNDETAPLTEKDISRILIIGMCTKARFQNGQEVSYEIYRDFENVIGLFRLR